MHSCSVHNKNSAINAQIFKKKKKILIFFSGVFPFNSPSWYLIVSFEHSIFKRPSYVPVYVIIICLIEWIEINVYADKRN